jgi:hypothetical protein
MACIIVVLVRAGYPGITAFEHYVLCRGTAFRDFSPFYLFDLAITAMQPSLSGLMTPASQGYILFDRQTPSQTVRCHTKSSANRLLVVLLSLVVNDVEELELVNTLGGGNDAEPVTELVLLEELLGAVVSNVSTNVLRIISIVGATYRYLRYRPESSLWAMISTLPSAVEEILMISPRLPVRPSILIFSFKNFSKAGTSKILSEAGPEALITNFLVTLGPFLAAVFF